MMLSDQKNPKGNDWGEQLIHDTFAGVKSIEDISGSECRAGRGVECTSI